MKSIRIILAAILVMFVTNVGFGQGETNCEYEFSNDVTEFNVDSICVLIHVNKFTIVNSLKGLINVNFSYNINTGDNLYLYYSIDGIEVDVKPGESIDITVSKLDILYSRSSSIKNIKLEINTTSTIEYNKADVSIFPNPTSDFININLAEFPTNDILAELFDMTGKMILNTKLYNNTNSLDISNLKQGMYMLVLNDNGNRSTHKIIKQ